MWSPCVHWVINNHYLKNIKLNCLTKPSFCRLSKLEILDFTFSSSPKLPRFKYEFFRVSHSTRAWHLLVQRDYHPPAHCLVSSDSVAIMPCLGLGIQGDLSNCIMGTSFSVVRRICRHLSLLESLQCFNKNTASQKSGTWKVLVYRLMLGQIQGLEIKHGQGMESQGPDCAGKKGGPHILSQICLWIRPCLHDMVSWKENLDLRYVFLQNERGQVKASWTLYHLGRVETLIIPCACFCFQIY